MLYKITNITFRLILILAMVETDKLIEPKPLRNYFCRSYINPKQYKMQSILMKSKFQSVLFHKCLSDQTMHKELCVAGKYNKRN